jgi:hypothetical protein
VIALLLHEEQEDNEDKSKWFYEHGKKRKIEGECATLSKQLTDDETKFHEYFRMSQH